MLIMNCQKILVVYLEECQNNIFKKIFRFYFKDNFHERHEKINILF